MMVKAELKAELVRRGLWRDFYRTRSEVKAAGLHGREAEIETLRRMGLEETIERFVKDRRKKENRVEVLDVGNEERKRDAMPDKVADNVRKDGQAHGRKAGKGGGGKAEGIGPKDSVDSKPAPKARRVSDSDAGFVNGLVKDGRMTWSVPKEVWRGRKCTRQTAWDWVLENLRTRIDDDAAANELLAECPGPLAWNALAEARESPATRQEILVVTLRISEKKAGETERSADDFDGHGQYDILAAMKEAGKAE